MSFIRALFTALVLCCFLMPSQATAQSPSPNEPAAEAGGFFDNLDGAVREFAKKTGTNLPKRMSDTGYLLADKLKTTALSIAGALALMYLMFEVIQYLGGRTNSLFTVLFDVGVPCVFASLLIVNYESNLLEFEKFLNIFRNMGTGAPIDALMGMYGNVVGAIAETIVQTFKNFGSALNPFSSFSGSAGTTLADMIVTLLFSLGLLFLIMVGVAEVLGLVLMGPFLFAVGVAFGPILIAGIVTPWTRDYFTKWIQFIVISAALTGVVGVVISIASALLSSPEFGVAGYSGDNTAVALIIMTVLVSAVNSMISQAPGIASALLPGHVGASSGGGKGLASAAAAAKKPAAATAKGAARGTGKAAVKGGKWAKKAYDKKNGGGSPTPTGPATPP